MLKISIRNSLAKEDDADLIKPSTPDYSKLIPECLIPHIRNKRILLQPGKNQ